ncbi:MAG: 2-phospho-L-lactate guanylyltransferase [Methanobacteriaceae archaeon]
MDDIYAIIPVSHLSNAKTRLSPFLSEYERENLLKAMLRDVTNVLKPLVNKIIIISNDNEVLDFGIGIGVETLNENKGLDLNGALNQAMDFCKDKCKIVMVVPSDVPLIANANLNILIKSIKATNTNNANNNSNNNNNNNVPKDEVIIIPSKGGGTNGLFMKPNAIDLAFGDYSFIKHQINANNKGINALIYDSFFMSLDVNTTEDLGEIILHGQNSETKKYLNSLNISVSPNRGIERLKVTRNSIK